MQCFYSCSNLLICWQDTQVNQTVEIIYLFFHPLARNLFLINFQFTCVLTDLLICTLFYGSHLTDGAVGNQHKECSKHNTEIRSQYNNQTFSHVIWETSLNTTEFSLLLWFWRGILIQHWSNSVNVDTQ